MNTTRQEADVLNAFGQLGSALGALELASQQALTSSEEGRLAQEYLDSLFDMITLGLEAYVEYSEAGADELRDICECAIREVLKDNDDESSAVDWFLDGVDQLVSVLRSSKAAKVA